MNAAMEEIKPLMEHSQIQQLLHDKLKAKLPARKSSLQQIIQKRHCLKILQNLENEKQSSKIKTHEQKKEKHKCLVYEVQGARRGMSQTVQINVIKMRHKRHTQGAIQKIQETQTDTFLPAENEVVLNDEFCNYINSIVDTKIKEVMVLRIFHVKYERPLVMFANFGSEPLTGRRYAWDDVNELPTHLESLWMMMLENRSPHNDNSYLHLQLTGELELCTISKEKQPHPEAIQYYPPGRPRRCGCLQDILSFLSLFGMLFAVFVHLYDRATRRQPLSVWEWLLNKLGNFLRSYLYIDMYSL